VRTVDDLVALYCSSVGRNGKLLLNVPPTRAGLLHDTDVARLAAFRSARDALFAAPLSHDDARTRRRDAWRATGPRTAVVEWDFGAPSTVGVARLSEDIARGQRVARYTLAGTVDGEWRTLSTGSTIGHAKIDRFEPVGVRRVRLTIEDAIASPEPVGVRLFRT
jgi:alpha-L-fucosidase